MRCRFWTCMRDPPPFRPFQSIENWKYSPIFHGTGGSPAVSGLETVSVGAAPAVGAAPTGCSAPAATDAPADGGVGKESVGTEEAAGSANRRKKSGPRTTATARPRI